jgi:hypothetical protein
MYICTYANSLYCLSAVAFLVCWNHAVIWNRSELNELDWLCSSKSIPPSNGKFWLLIQKFITFHYITKRSTFLPKAATITSTPGQTKSRAPSPVEPTSIVFVLCSNLHCFFSGLMKCNFWSSAQIEKDTFMATLACPRPITRNPQTHNNWSQAM